MIDVPTGWLWIGFVIALALTGLIGLGFCRYGLSTAATPGGILDFELAGDAEQACRIANAWRAAGLLDNARPNLRLDMVWIPCYAAALALGCLIAARLNAGWWASTGMAIAAGQLIAGLLDYGENIALLRTLSELDRLKEDRATHECAAQLSAAPPKIAAWCARMKLRLITVGLVYILMALLFWLLT